MVISVMGAARQIVGSVSSSSKSRISPKIEKVADQ